MALSEKVRDRIKKLPKENIINLLELSLDEMQAYNGQSISSAVFRAIDAECIDEEELRWRLPTQKQLREITNDGLVF